MIMDIENNRHSRKYGRKEQLGRLLWMWLGQPLFRYSFRTAFGWRRFLLRVFGARVGRETNIYNSAVIYFPWNLEIGEWSSIGEWVLIYNLGKIKIGNNTSISLRAHLCSGTHDYRDPAMKLQKCPITIADQAWVCADAFIAPGVSVGEGAVIGARAVVVRDVAPWNVIGGNPAVFIKKRIMAAK